jgi:hypothetical protein
VPEQRNSARGILLINRDPDRTRSALYEIPLY